MTTPPPPSKHEHLYHVALEHLALSEKLNRVLKKVSITSVGDCVEFFIQDKINAYPADRADYMDSMMELAKTASHVPFFIFMYGEVRQALQEHGYWSFVEDADIVNNMERRAARKRLIVKQQAKHQHLYDIPLRGMGLSEKALTALQRVSITSIGDCIKFFAQTREDYPADSAAYREKLDEMVKTVSQVPFFVFMFLEVEPMLRERGYWAFVEEKDMANEPKPTYTPKSPDLSSKYRHLFDVSIDHLGLSVGGYDTVLKLGMTSIGDCVEFYRRDIKSTAVITIRHQSRHAMYGEVAQKMKEQGYWSFVEDRLG